MIFEPGMLESRSR